MQQAASSMAGHRRVLEHGLGVSGALKGIFQDLKSNFAVSRRPPQRGFVATVQTASKPESLSGVLCLRLKYNLQDNNMTERTFVTGKNNIIFNKTRLSILQIYFKITNMIKILLFKLIEYLK